MGLLLLTLISLSLIPLALIRKRWSYVTIKIIIFLGTLDWIRTLLRIIKSRTHEGRPWLIAFIILFTVILVHIITLLVLKRRAVKEKFNLSNNK
jgi:hypothetical protein